MSLSEIKNIIPKFSTTKQQAVESHSRKQTQATTKTNSTKSQFKSTSNGVIFGICAGIGDGIATVYSAKNSVKKAIDEYKNYSFSEKKAAITGLHSKGVSVKEYKEYINSLHNLSMSNVMLKRAAIYGTAIGLFGLAIDTYRHYQNKQK